MIHTFDSSRKGILIVWEGPEKINLRTKDCDSLSWPIPGELWGWECRYKNGEKKLWIMHLEFQKKGYLDTPVYIYITFDDLSKDHNE